MIGTVWKNTSATCIAASIVMGNTVNYIYGQMNWSVFFFVSFSYFPFPQSEMYLYVQLVILPFSTQSAEIDFSFIL